MQRFLCVLCREQKPLLVEVGTSLVVWWPDGSVAQGQPVLLEAPVTTAFTSGKKHEARKFVIKQAGS